MVGVDWGCCGVRRFIADDDSVEFGPSPVVRPNSCAKFGRMALLTEVGVVGVGGREEDGVELWDC